jgi:uncharacterized protein (TIGR00255 family)
MIKSMTGFGRTERKIDNGMLSIEVRAVNSRYFDFSVRLPEIFEDQEEEIKQRFYKRIRRGRIKLSITWNGQLEDQRKVTLNRETLRHYRDLLNQANTLLESHEPVGLSQLLNFPDIFEVKPPELDEAEIHNELYAALEDVLSDLLSMQAKEGAHLAREIEGHLAAIREALKKIIDLSNQMKKSNFLKIREKMMALCQDLEIDENRLLQEVAINAKKIDITEECDRLESHLKQFTGYIDSDEPVGKRMTFLLQEMNREISTIGAKSENARISHCVVDVKNELEKIREQVQNIL